MKNKTLMYILFLTINQATKVIGAEENNTTISEKSNKVVKKYCAVKTYALLKDIEKLMMEKAALQNNLNKTKKSLDEKIKSEIGKLNNDLQAEVNDSIDNLPKMKEIVLNSHNKLSSLQSFFYNVGYKNRMLTLFALAGMMSGVIAFGYGLFDNDNVSDDDGEEIE